MSPRVIKMIAAAVCEDEQICKLLEKNVVPAVGLALLPEEFRPAAQKALDEIRAEVKTRKLLAKPVIDVESKGK